MANLNGIICINKPQNFTSFDVVAKMRGITKTKKIGHAGTLDPMATGVLPLFLGSATKACSLLPDEQKQYIADFHLGVQTDTYDIWGTVIKEQKSDIQKAVLENALAHFRGNIMQLPPMYSAVQINGRRLYDMARQGITVERTPRSITIDKLELLDFNEEKQNGKLEITCSKGTYVRSICHDLGELLGCGGIMSGLIRVKSVGFTIKNCITLEEAQQHAQKGDFSQVLLPVETLFVDLPKIRLNEIQSKKFANGIKLDLNRVYHQNKEGNHAVYSWKDQFLGIAAPDFQRMELVIVKMFAERESVR